MSVDLPAPFSPSSAWTSPRRTSNETSSFATTPGNSLRMPRISRTTSSTMRSVIGRRRRGRAIQRPPSRKPFLLDHRGDLELAVDDLRLVAVHQLDPRRLDLRARLTDADAVVLQVEDDVLASFERALRGGQDGVVDADVRLLQRAGEDPLGDAVFVRVDADAPLAEFRGLLECSIAAGAGDLEDHLYARADLVLREIRARLHVGEAVGIPHDRLRALDGLG